MNTQKVVCNKCGEPKPCTEEFFRPHGHAKGFRGACRECEAKDRRDAYAKNPERHIQAAKKWCRENRERHNATKRNWVRHNLEKHNATRRKSQYGITDSEFQNLFETQKGKCAICGFQFPGQNTGDRNSSPHVDHCHTTGKVRGLLCGQCNKGIGALKDSLELVESAVYYLQKNS